MRQSNASTASFGCTLIGTLSCGSPWRAFSVRGGVHHGGLGRRIGYPQATEVRLSEGDTACPMALAKRNPRRRDRLPCLLWPLGASRSRVPSPPVEVDRDLEIPIGGQPKPLRFSSSRIRRASAAQTWQTLRPGSVRFTLGMAVQLGSTTARNLLMLARALVQCSRVSVLGAAAIICST